MTKATAKRGALGTVTATSTEDMAIAADMAMDTVTARATAMVDTGGRAMVMEATDIGAMVTESIMERNTSITTRIQQAELISTQNKTWTVHLAI